MTINKQNIKGGFIWLAITMFYCYQYILRMLPNIIMPELIENFGLSPQDFGTFASIYYIGYIVVHIPLGVLLTRIGSKYILPICILLASIGLIPIIWGNNWYLVVTGRLLIGIGSSAAIIGALQTFRSLFYNNFSQVLGFTVSLSLITAMYGNTLLTNAITQLGLEKVINILILLGFLLTCFTFILLPRATNNEISHNYIRSDIKSVLSNYKLIFASLLAGLMVGPLEGFADAWGSAFLTARFDIDRQTAGSIISLILIGMCTGCLILPSLADKTNSHHQVTLLSGIAMAICFFYILSGEKVELKLLKLIFYIIGFFSAYQVVIIPKIATYVPEKLGGMAAALVNMIIMAFGSVFHKSIGFIIEYSSKGAMKEDLLLYDIKAYNYGISIIPIAILISIIGFTLILLQEKRLKNK